MQFNLELRSVSFNYGANEILKDINIQFKKGEFTAILGPNGTGKSTLLKICNKILEPQSGEVLVRNKNLKTLIQKEIARELAMVPQETHIAFPFTVAEVVLMGRHPYQTGWDFESDEDRKMADNFMNLLDVQQFARRSFNQLSGGEKQRTIIAAALAQTPSILLLDEPTSALDLKHQIGIYNILKQAQQEQELTLIIVTHDINLACMFCERLIFLKNGKIIADGTPKEVVNENQMTDLYETPVTITAHPTRHTPMVLPV